MVQNLVTSLQNFDFSGTGEVVLAKVSDAASMTYGLASSGVSMGADFADKGADMGITGIAAVVPWLTFIVWLIKILTPLAALGYGAYLGYKHALDYWKQGNPGEYQLHIRNGELINMGVGLTCWTMPGDQLVSFPSGIQQIAFEADQVTREM